MLIDAILKLHEDIQTRPLGSNRQAEITSNEREALATKPTADLTGLLR
jgi:NADH-quinone oxidoreductase subunit B